MLLDPDEFRSLHANGLEDDALMLLLDAAEQAIDARYGPLGSSASDLLDGGQSYLFLRRRASDIMSIVETDGLTDTTLATDDYRLRSDGVSVLRLATGTNRRAWWGAPVAVTYVPFDDEADRKRVQAALVEADLGYNPGTTMEQVGSWLEQRQQSSPAWNYATERDAILASLVATNAPGFA